MHEYIGADHAKSKNEFEPKKKILIEWNDLWLKMIGSKIWMRKAWNTWTKHIVNSIESLLHST